MREELYKGINFENDQKKLKWLQNEYCEKNIADLIKMRISAFLASIELIENKSKMVKLDNIEKAISQDIKKMLLVTKKVKDYAIGHQGNPLFVENENGEAELFYDEEKDSIQIYMEYFIYKYRVIVEYVVKILDKVIHMDESAYKKNNSKKHIGEYERTNVKLEYIRKLIQKYSSEQIDLEWFDEVRKVRNKLVHEGASCMIFYNGNEPLFQVYNLEVDDLFMPEEFLSNGNVISCKYFIAVTVSYLIYFVDTIFQILKNVNDDKKFVWSECKLNYKVVESEFEKGLDFIDKMYGISSFIPIYQKSLFEMIEQYLD
ncbi:MAG: hypothetical protein J1E83_10530 [Lachnospiraceae bacterium]|nr:hypothetical protein [Lachnospiraceae bacterium]